MQARVCLFGGTFDPIHCAHLRIAEEAVQQFALDRVLFVPAANPPHKDSAVLSPYEDRYSMVEIACAPYEKFIASRLEAEPQRSYSIDTVKKFRKQMNAGDRLFFLIGGDAFDEIGTWKDWRELITLTEFIVVARPGRTYDVPAGAHVHPLGLSLPVSSSEIRRRIAAGEPVPELPPGVREFIEEHRLYGSGREKVTASP